MLILTRRVGERVMIGNDTTLTVLEVRGKQVRVGIEAPKNVFVHREEIYRRNLERDARKVGLGGMSSITQPSLIDDDAEADARSPRGFGVREERDFVAGFEETALLSARQR